MGKVVFYGAVSMDGYLADQADGLTWLFETDTGLETTYEAFFETIDTTLMGRKTYQEAKKLLSGALLYPEKENYVCSTSLKEPLPDANIVEGDPVTFLQSHKEKNIWVVGGGQLLKPILEADLIDEWFIQIAPVLLGKGKRLFQEGTYFSRLQLIETTQMGQLLELHYKRSIQQ